MRKPTTCLPALVLSVAATVSGATSAFAFPITYTETVTANGSLNGTSFSSAIVTLKFVGDTANITSTSGVFINDVGTASVAVSTVNNNMPVNFITDIVGVDSAPNAALGHGTVTFADFSIGHDIVDDTSSAFATYALLPIAQVIGDTATVGTPGFSFPVAGGNFSLSSVLSNSPTFAAAPAPALGGPNSAAFVAVVLLAGIAIARRRKKP